jgi:hypothetical protein
MALLFTFKSILRQKKNYENSNIFHHAKTKSSKNLLKETKNPSRYYNSITNLKFQHKPKYNPFRNLHIKINLLTKAQNPLSYYNSILDLNGITLPLIGDKVQKPLYNGI